ncbi:MAG: bifunctional (p)ppGpp synthetase/guanosine-3',5'-bis(diphosphate) 3'-pyrophosphohydrolase [Anaerolineae bacterium]|nr:bifunctional (p)ppGpp synthetase/guanosine-3',5'-bis(diphosphate) 3'-pyrophosphohydrolase [Anaerolineae bacterium]
MSEIQTGDLMHPPTERDPDALYALLEAQVRSYMPEPADLSLLARAYRRARELHGDALRDSGEPYITHPLHVTLILAYLQLDLETLAAALLHDVLEDTPATHEALIREFGPGIADMVEGVSKLSNLQRSEQEAANIQKVFLAMSEDLRVIFIKLADRLHNMRTLHHRKNAASRERSAGEALSVYARIADRLGIALLRKEIEDLAFAYLNPDLFERVRASIAKRYEDNADRVDWIAEQVHVLLRDQGIRADPDAVRPNPRRVYDMFRRLQDASDPAPGKPKRVPPLLRFHLIVPDVPACYMAMAAIHAKWTPIASETRDYISAPLPNGYQSLHTTVFIGELPVKFQIRTMWMHTTSQLGIIAYMRGGELARASPELMRTVDDLREFGAEAMTELRDPIEFLTSLKAEVLGDDIYVYTPRNKVIQLPVGSTPIDFAYRIHTDVGHQCRGALVDEHWVSLKRPLRTGERVEILTAQNGGPAFEWLDPVLAYTQSPLAKGKIRRWFRRRSDASKLALGREQLGQIVDRLALQVGDYAALARRFNYADPEALFRDIGGCELSIERIVSALLEVYGVDQLPQICEGDESTVPVMGAGSLRKSVALCCRPQADDDIVGYILPDDSTVEVHRSNCPIFLEKVTQDPHRFIALKWGRVCETYQACMEILAYDRPFFLRDVWNILSEHGLNVADVDIQVKRAENARITICVDVESWLQFSGVLARIADLPGAIRVRRKAESVAGSTAERSPEGTPA